MLTNLNKTDLNAGITLWDAGGLVAAVRVLSRGRHSARKPRQVKVRHFPYADQDYRADRKRVRRLRLWLLPIRSLLEFAVTALRDAL